ncbi:MAG TPA: hypothetical protein VF725_06485 [Ktedonobacterales bacterium]
MKMYEPHVFVSPDSLKRKGGVMAVVSHSRRACLVAWLRARRRLMPYVAVVVVLLALVEIGVRTVTPDAMEIMAFSGSESHALLYDHLDTNAAEANAAYRALTHAEADWVDASAFTPPSTPGHRPLVTCQQYGLSDQFAKRSEQLVFRFLWHGIPIAVATHYPIQDNPYLFWTCQLNMTEWQISAGGVANPRPYVNDTMLTYFP